jgi:hypothetical protein
MTTWPNKITGANAGGPRQLPVWKRWAARVAQFWRSAASAACASTPSALTLMRKKETKTMRTCKSTTETHRKQPRHRFFWKWPVGLFLFGSVTVLVWGQVVDADRSSPGLVSAYESMGNNTIKVGLYKKTGSEFKLAATAEVKGTITFNSKGIVSGADTIRRLQFPEARDKWVSVSKSELVGGRAVITTDDGNIYTVFNLGIGPFAGQIESGRIVVADQQPASGIKPGIYTGTTKGIPAFSVTLVSANNSIKLSELGYEFAGFASVGHAYLKGREPFGTLADGKLAFQFRVLTSIGVPNLNTPKVNLGSGAYKAEITADTAGQLKCVLTQIAELDEAYSNFSFEKINFNFGADNPTLQKEYDIILKAKQDPKSEPRQKEK